MIKELYMNCSVTEAHVVGAAGLPEDLCYETAAILNESYKPVTKQLIKSLQHVLSGFLCSKHFSKNDGSVVRYLNFLVFKKLVYFTI